MKVLQIGSALFDWGGIERYLVYLNTGLEGRGHEVWLAAPPGTPLFERASGRKLPISLKNQFQLTRVAPYLRLFQRQKFDVVNVHFSRDFVVPAMAARLARQKNLILTRHLALHWSSSKVRRYSRLYDGFIGVSEAVAKCLVGSGVPNVRVRTALSGCPELVPTKDRGGCRTEFSVEGFAIGFFGRMVEEKGLRMLATASSSVGSASFHAFGDGPNLKEYAGLGSSIRFHGRVPDVADAMLAMDVVVIPSQWEEALSYVALEAMSLGKPVVATRTGGLPEAIVDGETGFLVAKDDVGGFAERLERLQTQEHLAQRMGDAGMARHRSTFQIEHMAERVELAYTELCSF